MPEENFKMDGFRCSLFSGFGWQAKQAPRVGSVVLGRLDSSVQPTATGKVAQIQNSPPLRIPEFWMALVRGIPSGRVPPVQNFSLILPLHCPT